MPPANEMASIKQHARRATEETQHGVVTVRGWMALTVICAVVAVVVSLSR